MPRRSRLLLAAAALAIPAAAVAVRAREPRDVRPCRPVDRVLARGVADGQPALPAARTGRLLVANQFSDAATIVDLATGAVTHVDTGEEPHDAAVSPDGRWGVVSNFGPTRDGRFDGHRLFVIDMARGRVARVIDTGAYRGLHDVAFRPGFPTRVLVTAQTSRRLLEVDVATGQVVAAIDTRGDRSHLVAVAADGRTAFTTNEGSATITRLDLAARAPVATFAATPDVEGIVVTPDGRELWVGENAAGRVTVRDASTGAVLATHAGFRYPNRIAIAPDGRRVVISDPGCRQLVVADAATRRVLSTTGTPDDAPLFVGDVAPDGRVAFAALSDDRAVVALDLETGRVLARHRARWHPDGLAWGPRAAP